MSATLSFREKLLWLRKRAQKSQMEMANELAQRFPDISISQTKISALETGEISPRKELLEALAEYFGVDVGFLLDASSEPNAIAQARQYLDSLRNSAAFSVGLSTHREHPDDADDYMDF